MNDQDLVELLLLRHYVHDRQCHPEYEYETTTGQRKAFYAENESPVGEGWERNLDCGRKGWERFEHHEESYWRRKKP